MPNGGGPNSSGIVSVIARQILAYGAQVGYPSECENTTTLRKRLAESLRSSGDAYAAPVDF
jgi:hypothetical protein